MFKLSNSPKCVFIRRLLWFCGFCAVAARVYRGLSTLDQPEPKDTEAQWSPLSLEID